MSIFLSLNSDNLFNDDFEETLTLLEEWFTIHENMDYAHRTRRVRKRWHSLKLNYNQVWNFVEMANI